MNKEQYAAYESAFQQGTAGLEGFSTGSWIQECEHCPQDADYEDGVCYDAEPYFSWHACEVCGQTDGGNREDAHAYYDGQLIHLRVCEDCVYYAEYGRLDDTTMAEL